MRRSLLPLALAVVLASGTACESTSGSAAEAAAGTNRPAETTAPDDSALAEAEPETEPAELEVVEEPIEEAETGPIAFGETFTYTDDLSVSVSAPRPYRPSEGYAEPGLQYVAFDVTVVNGTGGQFDPSMFTTTMQSANAEAEEEFDSEAGLTGSPSTTLLPGREARFTIGYGVTDPADLVLEVSPSFEHENFLVTDVA